MPQAKEKYKLKVAALAKAIRLDRKLSQAEAGEKLLNGRPQSSVSSLENGNGSVDDLLEYLGALATKGTRSRRTEGGAKRAGRVRSINGSAPVVKQTSRAVASR
jgi:hypothetical protein